MAAEPDVVELLRRALQALEPWADDVVLVGGWAMQLYRHLDAVNPLIDVTLTKDVDFAVHKLPVADELVHRLERQQLTAIRSRATHPAITYYQAAEYGAQDLAPSYIEFLTPLEGRGNASPLAIAPGIVAQRLRYLDLSFQQPRTVSLANVPWFADIGVATVRIPSPASYLLAQSLTYANRKPQHKDKETPA